MKPYQYLILLCLVVVGCKKSETTIIKKRDSITLKNDTTAVKIDTGWKAIADIASGPRTYSTGFTLNNKGYICGGVNRFTGTAQGYDDMYMYDPAKNTWTLKAGLPVIGGYGVNQGRMNAYSFVINNTAYAGGGLSVNGVGGSDLQQYDTVADKWTLKANKKAITLTWDFTFGNSAGASCNNLGYIFSYASGSPQIWMYDPVKNILAPSATLDGTYITDSECLSSSGSDLLYSNTGSRFYIMDPITGNGVNMIISPANNVLPPRGGNVALTGNFYKNCVYMSFGDEGHLYRYSFNTNKWTLISGRTMGITAGISSFLIGSKLYYVGGNNGIFTASTSKAWVINLAAYPDK